MALRLLDFDTVGKGRNDNIPREHPEAPGIQVLQDSKDPNGPKLQLHMKFFLDSADEPLSSEHFDNTEILMQVPLSKEELKILQKD